MNGAVIQEDGWTGGNFTLTQNFSITTSPPGPFAQGQCRLYSTANIGSVTQGAPISLTGQSNTPQFRSNPECAYNLSNPDNPTMFAIGGTNSTGGTANLRDGSYSKGDIWYSADGFATATYSPGQQGYPRYAANAAYLMNGNIVTWGGLAQFASNTEVFDTSVTYSPDLGQTWITTYTDTAWTTVPSVARFESAYCAVPYTNTLVTAGGHVAVGTGTANDVFESSAHSQQHHAPRPHSTATRTIDRSSPPLPLSCVFACVSAAGSRRTAQDRCGRRLTQAAPPPTCRSTPAV